MTPKSKGEAVTIARQKAGEYMNTCGSCSQSTLLALQDAFGLKDENLFKAAGGLTGGIGGMNDACGSLLGASLMFGVVFGRGFNDLKNGDKLGESMAAVGKLYKWYEKEFGSATCRDICTKHGGGVFYDRHVPWQAELAKEAGVHEKCAEMAQKTAAKAAEMIWDGQHKGQDGSNG
jgi:C_GCAxxG_C_C family probable redox protein